MAGLRKDDRSLLVVFAHPDDEACGPAGTLARYAAEGVRVTLVCLTRGGAGGPPEVRAREIARSALILGIQLELWDYPDNGLVNSDTWEILGRLVEVIRRVRPQVIITFGPNQLAEHPDHAITGWLTTLALELSGDCARWLGTLPPHSPTKLYFVSDPETARELTACCLAAINVAPYLDQRLVALKCHTSQRPCWEGFLRGRAPYGFDLEFFQLAVCRTPLPPEPEHDLFQGVVDALHMEGA